MRFIKLLLLLLVLGVAAGGVATYWANKDLHTPHEHGAASEIIVIEQGMGKKAIINRLMEKGILAHSWPVLGYLLVNPQAGKLQAGEYRFESPITPLDAL